MSWINRNRLFWQRIVINSCMRYVCDLQHHLSIRKQLLHA